GGAAHRRGRRGSAARSGAMSAYPGPRPSRYAVLAGRVVTADPDRATAHDPLGVVEDGGILVDGGRIAMVTSRAEVLAALRPEETAARVVLADAPGALLTPGLCDAHTHAAWMGSRHEEYAARMAGAGYEAIAARGGGIAASARAIAAASCEEIARELA